MRFQPNMLRRAIVGAFFAATVIVAGAFSAVAGGWERVTVNANNPPLAGIAIPADTTAIVVSPDQRIFRSTDQGSTWTERNTGFPPVLPPAGRQLRDVSFGTASDGIAVGSSGAITHTTDAGITWTNISFGDGNFSNISMVGPNFAVIPGSPIYRTVDGGLTWSSFPFMIEGQVSSVAMLDTLRGYGIGAFGLTGANIVFGTTDGGQSWTESFYPKIFVYLLSIAFGGSHGAAVGYDGAILNTTDGGVSWGVARSSQPDTLYDVAFRDEMNAYAVGSGGTILHSTDGGVTWAKESTPVSLDLRGVACRGSLTLVSGDSGVMLRNQEVSGVPDDRGAGSTLASLDVAPNPLRGLGSITCRLKRRALVHLALLDPLGRETLSLLEGDVSAGDHRVPIDPSGLPAGAYFLRFVADGEVQVRPLTIVR